MISPKNIKNYKKFTSIIFYIVLFSIACIFTLLKSRADPDLWHRLAVGKIFSQTGSVIYYDIFTYFPSKPLWIDHEWLSGVVFYNLSYYFGDFGLIILKTLIIFGIVVLIYKTNNLFLPVRNKYKILYYFLVIFAIIPGLSSVLRCQAFTYLFFALWIYLIERVRTGENKLIPLFPAIALLWANMHAGFLAGMGLLVFYAAGEFLNRKNFLKYIGILALCLPVTLINPYGIKYPNFLAETVPMKRPFIEEWESFNLFGPFFDNGGVKILLLLLIFAVFYRAKSLLKTGSVKDFLATKLDWTKIIILFGTLYMGFAHQRHLAFFAVAAGAFLYGYFAITANNTFLKIEKLFIKKNIFKNKKPFLLEFSFIIAFIFISFTIPARITLDEYPVKAIEFIKINRMEGNLLVPFGWGSYALWKLYPQNLVSSDGRYEETYIIKNLYEANAMILTADTKKWNNLLENYHHDIILISSRTPFYDWLLKKEKWREVYRDETSAVFRLFSVKSKKLVLPKENENYYIETKFENNINVPPLKK